jgi:hypothetical protein
MARPAEQLRSVHDLLQSFRSLAASWRLSQDYERTRRGHDVAVQMIDTSIVRVHQRELPFEIRRDQLDSLRRGVDGITFSEAIEGDGAVVFAHAY